MKKLMLLIVASLMLVACGDDVAEETEPVEDIEEEITEDEVELDPLPFNVDKVISEYEELSDSFEGSISADENQIIYDGNVYSANELLGVLNKYIGDGEVNKLSE